MKYQACESYVVLLANGYQLERFLIFGDSKRILNPTAKYIFLHDYRLFTPSLHYIWKRFVNVVFIRQYSHKPVINFQKAGKIYELSTVPFPSSLKDVFVSRRLDYWQAGHYRYSKKIFADKTNDLMGETFKTVVFPHTPAVIRPGLDKNRTYTGLEIEIISAFQKAMNFKVEFYETKNSEEEKWGQADENGTYNGLLREMHDANAEFALADLYYTAYNLKVFDLTIPYFTECLTFLTPEATNDNSWKTLILPFSGNMWAGVLFSLFTVGFIFYGVSFFYRNKLISGRFPEEIQTKTLKKGVRLQKQDVFDSISSCILNTYSMLVYVSLPKFPIGTYFYIKSLFYKDLIISFYSLEPSYFDWMVLDLLHINSCSLSSFNDSNFI